MKKEQRTAATATATKKKKEKRINWIFRRKIKAAVSRSLIIFVRRFAILLYKEIDRESLREKARARERERWPETHREKAKHLPNFHICLCIFHIFLFCIPFAHEYFISLHSLILLGRLQSATSLYFSLYLSLSLILTVHIQISSTLVRSRSFIHFITNISLSEHLIALEIGASMEWRKKLKKNAYIQRK